MFPYDAMPELAQTIAEALPATHFIRLVRGVVLHGATITDLTFDIGWLLAFTAVMLTIATLRFTKRLN